MRSPRRLIAALATTTLATATLAAVTLTVSPAPATAAYPTTCPTSGSWEYCITSNPATQSAEIPNRLTALVNATAAGGAIHIQMYQFGASNYPAPSPEADLAKALIDAAVNRDVDVKVIVDGDDDINPPTSPLINDLKDPANDVTVEECENSCIQSDNVAGAIYHNHSKFATFKSTVGGVTSYAVAVTSSNMIRTQRDSYQNLVIRHNDVTMYNLFETYFTQLRLHAWQPSWDTQAERGTVGNGSGWDLSALPVNPDPILDTLNRIDSCVATPVGAPHNRVRVDMAIFNPVDRRLVADALIAAYQDENCDVKVITSSAGCGYLIGPAKIPKANVRLAAQATGKYPTHDKVVIVDTPVANGTIQKLTLTGSANLARDTINGNDDLVLKITDDTVTNAYFTRFDTIWANAAVSCPETAVAFP